MRISRRVLGKLFGHFGFDRLKLRGFGLVGLGAGQVTAMTGKWVSADCGNVKPLDLKP